MYWVRPTQAEYENDKILAWYVTEHHTFIGGKEIVLAQPCPYYARNLLRRHARGDSLPDFVTVNETQPAIAKITDIFDIENEADFDAALKRVAV